jgi:hypothetical protein
MSEISPPRPEDLRQPTAPAAASPVLAGWYPDHNDPKRERWWDGQDWTALTHASPKAGGLYSPAYQRSLWAGANRLAGVARVLNLLALLLILLGVFSLATEFGTRTTLLILVGLGLLLAVAGLVSAIIALRRSRKLGAKTLAIYQLVASSFELLLGLIFLGIGFAL